MSSERDAPSLDFGWEEDLFSAVVGLFRKVVPSRQHPGSVESRPLLEHLTTLSRVVSGLPLNVVVSRGAGGIRDHDVLVPQRFALSEDDHGANYAALVVHVLVSSASARLLADRLVSQPKTIGQQLSLANDAVEHLLEEWPAFVDTFNIAVRAALPHVADEHPAAGIMRAIMLREPIDVTQSIPERGAPPSPLWGRVFAIDKLLDPGLEQPMPEGVSDEVGTEIEAPSPEELKIVQIDEKKAVELPSHIFEKAETADEYRGEQKTPDGEDELADQLDALESLDLDTMYRGNAPANSLYHADIRLTVDIPDVRRTAPHEQAIAYDEWDHRRGRYRKDWAFVYPTSIHGGDDTAAEIARAKQGEIAHLVRALTSFRTQLRPQHRQLDGDEIDLNALVNDLASTRAGHSGDGRLYERRARHSRDQATTVLLDVSLSSDSWVAEHRVLDVAREAVVVLGEVMHVMGDQLQVLAFASNTHNLVRVWEIKSWSEDWSTARRKIGVMEPQGYTRIGPALRHAIRTTARHAARERLVLLLSDGKPTDYDRYEGAYGIQDVRQAVREGKRAGVRVHGLAIDQRARNYLPSMLGESNWALLPNAKTVGAVLTEIYARLAR